MFWGQPYCKACGFCGPNFMYSWHHWSGVGVLVQDQKSLALRVIDVADPGRFTGKHFATEDALIEACQQYVESVVASELRPGERVIPIREFFQILREGEPQQPTKIACPECRSLLYWQDTGIS